MLRICLICSLCLAAAIGGFSLTTRAQRGVRRPTTVNESTRQATPPKTAKPAATPSPEPSPEEVPVVDDAADQKVGPQDVESLKTDTNLVTVPVIAATREGIYVPDLTQAEFAIEEDGKKQEIAFFAAVSAPFHVVLLLDTSASTENKLRDIRKAAVAFVEQLQKIDRVKVISFDTELRDLCEFTNDRTVLTNAIYKTTPGQGTRLYDAFELALDSIRTIKGRKAIVLFTDGVDMYSDRATYASSLKGLDEEGVIVYPIRYETRAQTERIVRDATESQGPQLPTIDVIRREPPGTTAPTFPSDDPQTVPTSGQRKTTGPFGLPSPDEIMRRRPRQDPDPEPFPDGSRPSDGSTRQPDERTDRDPNGRVPNDPLPDRNGRGGSTTSLPPSGGSGRREGDSVDVMLDQMYLTAEAYLAQLANASGGRLLRADTLDSLPDAFKKIAAELRSQYAIGYYPTNKTRDGQYRKIKVTATRKNVVVRARPGYRAPSGG
ncbi:MAG TPA: VWA domain-containing protein [Pyrinomonadaceae bacterium]|jgi:Mg-chelatase subunit ChlD|nr:VWA domain-containing protein [Pyrinomonadaceae bacterium]